MNKAPRQNIERALTYRLTGVSLKGILLEQADLTGADLKGADLAGAHIDMANLTGADLTGANLTGAQLDYSDFTGANLKGANLTGANLIGANLTEANLTGARLYAAHLDNATITEQQIQSATLTPSPLDDADLQPAPALITYVGCGVSKTLELPAWKIYPTERPQEHRILPPELRSVLASRLRQVGRTQVQILASGADLERSEARASKAHRAAYDAEVKNYNTCSALAAHLALEGLTLHIYTPLALADKLNEWADS